MHVHRCQYTTNEPSSTSAQSAATPGLYFATATAVAVAAAAAAVAAAAAALAAAVASAAVARASVSAAEGAGGGGGEANGFGSGIGITGTMLTPNGDTGTMGEMMGGAITGGGAMMVVDE